MPSGSVPSPPKKNSLSACAWCYADTKTASCTFYIVCTVRHLAICI